MMQCASCETQITDVAAETGVCPKCGMPLPGIGGTMRFSPSAFADLPGFATMSPATTPESPAAAPMSPADELALRRTVVQAEPDLPRTTDPSGSVAVVTEDAAQRTLLVPPESESPADTYIHESPAGAADGHDTDRHSADCGTVVSAAASRERPDATLVEFDQRARIKRQCASCETPITDVAAETGVCPKCGMPLPGSGGTMRFSPSVFADLPGFATVSPATTPESPSAAPASPADELALRTLVQAEPDLPQTTEPSGPVAVAAEDPAQRTLLVPPEPELPADTHTRESPAGAADGHDTDRHTAEDDASDINKTIDSRKLSPAEARRYESTLIGIPDEIGTDAGEDSGSGPRGSGTQPVPGVHNDLREHGDTTLFGPEKRLVIQPRELSARDMAAPGAPSLARPDYELVEVIGRGGMGLVYAAKQTSVDREVAVKMIWPAHAQDPSARENFLSEAVITGELDHPNIVPIHDVGKDSGNALFYSMKRVSGTAWQKVVATTTLTENLRILMAVADAVAFAHSRGVVHRDLKPENVMLGEFGEVMVMDWGLAIVTREFRRAESVSRTIGAGCTPSYAAPELVTGPISAIGPHSDVYLLGAILYKILTGKPPHLAPTPQECCRAAARNEIQPTTQTGELVEIALKAMASHPANRFASVQEFQDAIRTYQSHSESLVLSARAGEDLEQARRSGNYQDFARSLFGYQEAIKQWDGNDAARRGLSAARLAYAESALGKEDYDLGLTLVDANDPAQKPIATRLLTGQRERNQRRRRLKVMYRTAIGLVAVIFVGGAIGMVAINQEKETAKKEKKEADTQRVAAVKAQREEEVAKKQAETNQQAAEKARGEAETAKNEAVDSEKKAINEQQKALSEKQRADSERLAAIRSQRAQAFEAYVAQIGLASEQINANAFDAALAVLQDQQHSPYRGWEWYRLDYLARQGQTTSAVFDAEVEAVALDSTGARFVAGLRDGHIVIGGLQDLADQKNAKFLAPEHGAPVLSVALSPDDQFVASAGEFGTLAVWNVADGKRVGPQWSGHAADKPIHHVKFITLHDGRRWLLTASADRTARLWDVSGDPATWKAEAAQILRGHHLQVWDAAMSPDGKQIVTAGDDGRVVVWEQAADRRTFVQGVSKSEVAGRVRRRIFTGHNGAVYAVAFSPDGKLVASSGLDQRVLLWDPQRVVEGDLKDKLEAGADSLPGKRSSLQAVSLEGHTEPVHCVAFSPDGQYVVSGSDDNTIRVWPRNGDPHEISVLRGHGGWVRSCLFAPQPTETGDWNVVSGSHDRRIKLWNVAGYAEVRALRVDRLTDHDDAVLGAAFSPRGDQIVTASRDHVARVWQLSPGKNVPRVADDSPRSLHEGHDFSVTVAIYLRDGRRVVTSGIDGQVCLWDSETGAQLGRLPGTGLAAAVALTPDDQWILTGSTDAAVKLWQIDEVLADYAAGRESAPVHRFEGHEFPVRAIAVSPDGSGVFYSGDNSGSGRLWSLADRNLPPRVLTHHTQRVNAAAFTPDGARLLTAADDGNACLCDALTGALVKKLEHRAFAASVVALALTPDGRRAITIGEPASENEPFVIFDWDVASSALQRKSAFDRGLTVFGLAVSPQPENPLALLSIGIRSTGKTELRGWNLAAWQEERASDGRQLLDDAVLSGEHATVWSAAWTPQGKRVVTVGGYEAEAWQLDGRRLTMRLGPHRAVAAAGFSSDGRFVVTGSWDESFKIWNVDGNAAQSLHRVPISAGGAVNSAVFSPVPNSFQILTAHDDGMVRLWNWDPEAHHAQPGTIAEFAHPRPVNAAVFSRDGSRILALCADGMARVWGVANARKPELELKGQHHGPILCGAFSPDGKWIATGGEDKLVVVWNADTGLPWLESPLQGHSAAVNSLDFSESGDRLVTGSRDNTAKLWDPRTVRRELLASPPPADEMPTDAADDADAVAETKAAVPIEEKLRGKELLTLHGHSAEVTAVAFSPDGRFVLTSARDNTAILWLTNKP